MTIEIALLVSVVSVVFGVYSIVSGARRNSRNDARQDAAGMTTVLIKLEGISDGVKEIKTDFNAMKADMKEINETVIKTVASLEAAWKRIDELKMKMEAFSK